MKKERMVKLIFLFVLTYLALYFLGQFTELHNWEFTSLAQMDYMFFLIPIPGFFFMYLLVDWAAEYYRTEFTHSILFPLLFVVVGLAAFYVVLYWYWENFARLANRQEVVFDYVAYLLNSAYLVFMLSALGGWASHVLLDRLGEGKE